MHSLKLTNDRLIHSNRYRMLTTNGDLLNKSVSITQVLNEWQSFDKNYNLKELWKCS